MPQASRHEFRADLEAMRIDSFLAISPQDVARRAKAAGIIFWEPADRMPIDVFSIIRDAAYCFCAARHLAAIALASSGVEVIINKDSRGRALKFGRPRGWAYLNNKNVAAAMAAGFPVAVLIDQGERLDASRPIRFIERRNKVAHGDLAGIVSILSDYDTGAESEALDQLLKAQQFIIEWFNTSPDVRDGIISGHRWAP